MLPAALAALLAACAPKVTAFEGDIVSGAVDVGLSQLLVVQDPLRSSSLAAIFYVGYEGPAVDANVRIWLAPAAQPQLESYILEDSEVALTGSDFITRNLRSDVAGTRPGTYVLNCRVTPLAPIGDTNVQNNTVAWPIPLVFDEPARPDLAVEASGTGSVAPTALTGPGSVLQVTVAVRNVGIGDAGPCRIGIYASQDTTITRSDMLLGYAELAPLTALSLTTFQVAVNTPSLTPNVNYEIGWIVDPDDVIGEDDESNNSARVANGPILASTLARPDLTTSFEGAYLSQYGILAPGNALAATCVVRNQGSASAASCPIAFYASLDATVTVGDILLGTATVGPIAAGGAATVVLGSANTSPLASGQQYHVGWIADATNAVLEHSEANNSARLTNRLTVGAIPALPDLATQTTGSSFTPSVLTSAGLPVQVRCEVRNLGSTPSPECLVAFYASTDGDITTNDLLLGTHTVASIPAGGQTLCTLDTGSTVTLATGQTYTIGWLLDPTGAIAEGSESNNRAVASGQFTLGGSVPVLAKGVPQSFVVPSNGLVPFALPLPNTVSAVSVTITGTGDADLYVKRQPIQWPSDRGRRLAAEFRAPYLPGSSESVLFAEASGGAWNVLVHGYGLSQPSIGTIVADWSNSATVSWVRESPHPYENSATYQATYSAPGATQVGVHFERLATESGFDFVHIRNAQGAAVYTVSGNRIQGGQSVSGTVFGRTDGWCYVDGSSMTIQLVTDGNITDYGLRTDLAYATY